MWNAKHQLLKTLFPEGDPKNSSLKRPPTVGFQFKSSVSTLMKNLYAKNPNYIRCLKPNGTKKPSLFDDSLVKTQILYLGLLENVKVRRAGFAYRQLYKPFLDRYKMICKMTWPRWEGEARDGVSKIIAEIGIPSEEAALGHTKIFIRTPSTLFDLEERRRHRLDELATIIQKIYRGWQCRIQYLNMRKSQILISAVYRGFAQKKKYQKIKFSALLLQAYVRGWKARVILRRMKLDKRKEAATTTICAYWRGYKVRREFRKQFKSSASRTIANFIYLRILQIYFLGMKNNLPSMSPANKSWAQAKYKFLAPANQEVMRVFQQWKCKKYRDSLTPQRKALLQDKLCASELFNGKKKSYPTSVPKPFQTDYVGIQKNPKFQKAVGALNGKLVIAEGVQKISKTDGKGTSMLLFLTNTSLGLADAKGQIKAMIKLEEIASVAVSKYNDGTFLIQLIPTATSGIKGDLLLTSVHSIEVVTKLYQSVLETTKKKLNIQITDEFSVKFKKDPITVKFIESTVPNGKGPVYKKKGSQRVEVLV
ncbi:hypothetical protein GDO86_004309 [Hymenochirus boettgeri]|uniref:Unconventional myosin-Ia n=1 Tax=Hymenochirus boettgeri TaxID=247094 RepID=A0A8T2KA29_9PIPI|nr:hypothetical protein GDO86_004309 [Hymenochirus boettgeri]